MFKAFSIIVVLLVLAVTVILIIASQKPDTFHFQRSIVIKAPAEKIFPYINDLNAWRAWSPYEKKDPAMKRTMSGPPAGKGAGYAWDGNKNVGAGSMEITESAPPSKVVFKLDFIKPFEGHNTATFILAPRGAGTEAGTEVTWALDGPAPLLTKVMSIFFNMDKMVGDDFTDGLASLKAIAEKQ
jgi:uncharacterized protein YndB with AHSA1/START domain